MQNPGFIFFQSPFDGESCISGVSRKKKGCLGGIFYHRCACATDCIGKFFFSPHQLKRAITFISGLLQKSIIFISKVK